MEDIKMENNEMKDIEMKLNLDENTLENIYDNMDEGNSSAQILGIKDNVMAVITVNGSLELDKPKVTLTYGILSKVPPKDTTNVTINLNSGLLNWAGISITAEQPLYFTPYEAWELNTNEISYKEIKKITIKELSDFIVKYPTMIGAIK